MFNRHADTYKASTKPKNIRKQTDSSRFFSQYRAMTSDIRHVVTSIPETTAKPAGDLTAKVY